LNIGKVTILNFKVLVIENHWKFKMAEGPLVSVQHRLIGRRTLATRVRDICAAALHLTATLPPDRRPRVPSRPTLSPRRSSWKRPFDHLSTSPDAAVCFTFSPSPLSAPRR
jgi:hypothetical protein